MELDGGPTRAERVNAWVLAAGIALIWLAIAWPIVRGECYVDSDLGRFHLQMRRFYADALNQGFDFHWYPYTYAGFHLHGEGQAALYHPLNWLSYRLLPFQLAFGLELLRNYVLLVVGGYLYLRHCGLRRDASLLGSALFGFGSFSTYHFMHINGMAIVAHLPWLAWGGSMSCSATGAPSASRSPPSSSACSWPRSCSSVTHSSSG